MLESLSLFEQLFSYFNQTIRGEAPLWLYVVLALIPICVIIAVRETFCWFFKVNGINRRLDRLDKRLMVLNGTVEEIIMIMKHEIQKNRIRPSPRSAQEASGSQVNEANRQKASVGTTQGTTLGTTQGAEEFTLEDRPWSEK
jgi:hypothetical protein